MPLMSLELHFLKLSLQPSYNMELQVLKFEPEFHSTYFIRNVLVGA
jgi:hypothetical protein